MSIAVDSETGRTAMAAGRADELYAERLAAGYRRVDRLFAVLLPVQWVAAVAFAVWLSPYTWAGESASVHVHVWAAVGLGGLIVALPLFLIHRDAGSATTRHAVAVAQMLMGALLIHISGGRIETHFHVFGSLAFLALYRDWRVLDHRLGGRGPGPFPARDLLAAVGLRRRDGQPLAMAGAQCLGRLRGHRADPRLPPVARRAARPGRAAGGGRDGARHGRPRGGSAHRRAGAGQRGAAGRGRRSGAGPRRPPRPPTAPRASSSPT